MSFLSTPVAARRKLSSRSLVTCMDNSKISPTYFNVTFNPDDGSLHYQVDLSTELSSYVRASAQVYAYGFLIISRDIDLCGLGWKQFCPMYPGSMQIESIEYVSKTYIDMIPGIAFTVPDIDAVLKLTVYDLSTNEKLACVQASFSNGKTVSQTGAKWATAVIAGLGLLISALLSTFGNSNAASHISANAVSLFLYFQSVVVVSMQHVERVPPIASAWAENLAWSMGLIRVEFMQKIFRWYVQATGGTPTTYFLGTSKQILVQRSLDYLDSLHELVRNNYVLPAKRALDFSLRSNTNLIVLRGIKRIGFNSHIEPTSIVVTGFTFFVLCGFVLTFIIVLIKNAITLLIRMGKVQPTSLSHFRTLFSNILKGTLLRYIYIGFTQLVILSLWEFLQRDSPAVIVLSVLFLILSLGMILYALYKTWHYGKLSIELYKNPAAILYGDSGVLSKFGFCYTMFHALKYWFGIVLIAYTLAKGIVVGLFQFTGKASSLALFIIDLAYTIYLIMSAPYLNKATNIVNYTMSIVITLNSFLFIFFSDVFGQPAPVASIMGWVFFILNAAFSFCLLVLIVVFIVYSVISKNPDARFAPAKDDRASFQRKSSMRQPRKRTSTFQMGTPKGASLDDVANDELAALGIAAQDHTKDWEGQMYKLNNMSEQFLKNVDDEELGHPSYNHIDSDSVAKLTPTVRQSAFSDEGVDGSLSTQNTDEKAGSAQEVERDLTATSSNKQRLSLLKSRWLKFGGKDNDVAEGENAALTAGNGDDVPSNSGRYDDTERHAKDSFPAIDATPEHNAFEEHKRDMSYSSNFSNMNHQPMGTRDII